MEKKPSKLNSIFKIFETGILTSIGLALVALALVSLLYNDIFNATVAACLSFVGVLVAVLSGIRLVISYKDFRNFTESEEKITPNRFVLNAILYSIFVCFGFNMMVTSIISIAFADIYNSMVAVFLSISGMFLFVFGVVEIAEKYKKLLKQ